MLRLRIPRWPRPSRAKLPPPAAPSAGGTPPRLVPLAFAPPGLVPTPRVIYRTRRKELSHVKRVLRLDGESTLALWRDLANGFIRARPDISAEVAGYLLQRGFLADRAVLYDLPNPQDEDYLSDLQIALLPQANGRDAFVLENRVLFAQVFGRELPFARRLCTIHGDNVVSLDEGQFFETGAARDMRWVHALPVEAGAGVPLAIDLDARLIHSAGGTRSYSDLRTALASDGRNLLLVEDTGAYGPVPASGRQCANRLRILILRSADVHVPAPVAAIYSVARSAASPDLSVAGGAISAAVNLDSGRIDRAVLLRGRVRAEIERHPETGAAIVGQRMPHWPTIIATLQRALRTIPMFAVVQFDLALTSTGFLVFDAKSRCDAAEFQVHGPLMGSLRTQEFLRDYGL